MFLHFYAFEHLIRGNQPEFLMVRSGLEKYHPRKKVHFWPTSESCLTFQKLMWFYLLTTKDSLMSKVWDKTFFRCKCCGPLLQRSLLATRLRLVFLPTFLSCLSRFLCALQQNRAQPRLLYLLIRMFRNVTEFTRMFHGPGFINGP